MHDGKSQNPKICHQQRYDIKDSLKSDEKMLQEKEQLPLDAGTKDEDIPDCSNMSQKGKPISYPLDGPASTELSVQRRICFLYNKQDFSLRLSALAGLDERRHNPSLHSSCPLIGQGTSALNANTL